MTIDFGRRVIGPRVAAFRNDRSRWNLANLFAGERRRLTELDREIDRRAYAFAPADRNLQERARRAMTQAAEIALTGSYAK
ncbi:hypothetical protein MMAG44476_32059 [Mycolicibacterium mageritense DSM 44476 = CIP 104973]|uniref:Uncharacterized protein n=1 Tax=Mycolicibacterium mageritense TaxID=53462 RepID=A0ABM7I141_MYCME|nr:hypothetical protein [Mycolicibacterium mageritense]MCC9187112.1 hypothetical protein [Mycolicibacterium mageritense]BBX36595.1 hypothetical protein MMAGJ_58770 [Mycolicibacterium mageritense]CDO24698.1 hypothetical protein BN978_05198 [Mycolicibacterium mageritense DSM 44476 = CIP 104973]